MTRIEFVLRELSDLYEFNESLQAWKKRATVYDPVTGRRETPEDREREAARRAGGADGR